MIDKNDYQYVERWNRTDSTHMSRFFATNEQGDPRPQTREEFVFFMKNLGFQLELTVDAEGKGHWTDDIKRVWHDSSGGHAHESAECGGDQEVCSALHRAADQNGATK